MPADFELKRDARIVRSRAWGVVTNEDLLRHMARIVELFNNGTLDSTWSQLADFSSAEDLGGLSVTGIQDLATRNPWPKGSYRAIVTPRLADYGLARMYQLFGDTVDGEKSQYLRVFRSAAEAEAWITESRAATRVDT